MSLRGAALWLGLLCGAACGSGGDASVGQAELGFSMDEAVRVNFRGDLSGTILGQIYPTADVTIVGGSVVSVPDSARAVQDVQVDDADFRETDRLAKVAVLSGLPPGEYTFLGALDVDGNESDIGDPVTFSRQGSFVVTEGDTVSFEVVFNGIQPF